MSQYRLATLIDPRTDQDKALAAWFWRNTHYQIEYSTDKRPHLVPIVKDWRIGRMGDEPSDFWSQSFCYGLANIAQARAFGETLRLYDDLTGTRKPTFIRDSSLRSLPGRNSRWNSELIQSKPFGTRNVKDN